MSTVKKPKRLSGSKYYGRNSPKKLGNNHLLGAGVGQSRRISPYDTQSDSDQETIWAKVPDNKASGADRREPNVEQPLVDITPLKYERRRKIMGRIHKKCVGWPSGKHICVHASMFIIQLATFMAIIIYGYILTNICRER